MKIIYFLLRYSPRLMVLAILAGIISGASNTGLLALINAILTGSELSTATLAWGFVALCVLVGVSRVVSEFLLTGLGQGALVDLRMQLSRKILSVPLRKLEELGAHRLMAALTDDVPNITGVVTTIPILCINVAVVLSCLVYLGWLSWAVLLLVLGCMAVGVATYQIPIVRAMRHARLAREAADALHNHLRALTDGIKELKLHGDRREAFLTDSLHATSESLRRHNVNGFRIFTVAASWGQLLIFVVIGVLLFTLPLLWGGDARTMTGYTITILYMMTPLQVVMNTLPALGRANVALRKVEELGLELEANATERPTAATTTNPSWRRLELSNVTHVYRREGEESDFVLGPINLSIESSELIFLAGGNGSGKTTLAKLIVGLYIPEGGEIRLDGVPVTDENREQYRGLFSVVFSDFYLFDSLLGLGDPRLDERAGEHLSRLQLSHKVQVKNGALSSTELSQGQRKRLALLTAYLEDRPIYLFDEWAADQDPHFKEVFYLHLLPDLKARGKTIIVISHDDKYYYAADRLLKLEDGKLSEAVGDAYTRRSRDELSVVPN
jgi:putative ATP-binding cassette transporter